MNKESITENEIGEIGTLHVTNRRIHGLVSRDIMEANRLRTENVDINIPLGRITCVAMNLFDNWDTRKALSIAKIVGPIIIVGFLWLFDLYHHGWLLLVLGISLFLDHKYDDYCAKTPQDGIRISFTIDGVDYYIPFKLSEKETAEAKFKMLKDAKREYDSASNG